MFGYYIIKCCLPKVVSLLGAFLLLLSQGHALDCTLVCQLCTRTQIQCFNLGLISVPRNFPKTITLITLSRNNISRLIPTDFRGFNRLSALFLDNTGLVYVHPQAFFDLSNLYYLHLNHNQIQHFHPGTFKGLTKLHYLYLQHNQIISIPGGLFSDLTAIRYLHLEQNHLGILGSEAFANMPNLHTLHLGNLLTRIPSHTFGGLKHVKRLALSKNPIDQVHPFMAATLKILHLANNHLSSLRAEVLRPLASLAHLLVSGNPWECNCQLLDLRGWLLSSSLIVSIRCQSPLELCGKALQNINVKEIGRCNTTLAPLALDARERASTTNIVMTSVKLDTQNAAFKVKGSPITFHEFGNENERTEKLTSGLPVQIPIEYTSVNLSIFTGPNNAPISIKPLYICEQLDVKCIKISSQERQSSQRLKFIM
uniref:Leucine rich repeat containing 70 n=1 Tax=Callorhinchus milii TaxID=7868 RepID=A0A4W3JUK5_CALMI